MAHCLKTIDVKDFLFIFQCMAIVLISNWFPDYDNKRHQSYASFMEQGLNNHSYCYHFPPQQAIWINGNMWSENKETNKPIERLGIDIIYVIGGTCPSPRDKMFAMLD